MTLRYFLMKNILVNFLALHMCILLLVDFSLPLPPCAENEFEVLRRSSSADSTELAKSQGAIESNSNSIRGVYEDPAFSGDGGPDLSNGHLTLSCQQVEHPAKETNASRFYILYFSNLFRIFYFSFNYKSFSSLLLYHYISNSSTSKLYLTSIHLSRGVDKSLN